MKKVLITGGTGLVGQRLTELLLDKGYEVWHLGRSKSLVHGVKSSLWNIDYNQIDEQAFENTYAIIHLAGAGVADKKWTEERKKEIYDSRINGTGLLLERLKRLKHQVKVFIGASAIGYYGNCGDKLLDETNYPGSDFLAITCKDWETVTKRIQEVGVRTSIFRIGIVLSDKGGFIPKVSKPIRMGFGAPIGSGNQYVSWVHIDDLCNMFIWALEKEEIKGIYNGVASEPVSNKELTKQMARVLNKPLWLPNVPVFALKMMFGEMANSILASQNVSNQKITSTGFTLQYGSLQPALTNVLKK